MSLTMTKTFSLDFSRKTSLEYIFVKQGDRNARILEIIPLNDGQPYVIPEGVTVRFGAKKPDGTQILNDAEIVTVSGEKRIRITLSEQALAAAGIIVAEVALYGSTGELLTSQAFFMKNDPYTIDPDAAESSAEYESFVQALLVLDAKISNAENATEAAASAAEAARRYSMSTDRIYAEKSENLYRTENDAAGKGLTSDGSLSTQSGYSTTGMLKVAGAGKIAAKYMAKLAFYDEDGVFVTGSYKSGSLSETPQAIPEGSAYARVSFYTSQASGQYIKIGSGDSFTLGDYVPYGLPEIKDDNGAFVCVQMARSLENSIEVRNNGEQLYDKNDIENDKQLVLSGATSANAGKFTTGFIRVIPGSTVYISKMYRYAEYGIDQKLIIGSYDEEAKTNTSKAIGSASAYIRVTNLYTSSGVEKEKLVISAASNTIPGASPSFGLYDGNRKITDLATGKYVLDSVNSNKYLKNYQLTEGTVIDPLNDESSFTSAVFPASYYKSESKKETDLRHLMLGPSLRLRTVSKGYVDAGTFTAGESLPSSVSGVNIKWYSDEEMTTQITACPVDSPKLYYKAGKSSLQVRKKSVIPLGDNDLITFWLYVSDVDKSHEVQFKLYSGGSTAAAYTASYSIYTNKLECGWNMIPVMEEDFTVGNSFSFDDITSFGFYIVTASGADEFAASVADLRIGRTFSPRIVFRFDDALKGVHDNAFPILHTAGLSGITYANGAFSDKAEGSDTTYGYYTNLVFEGLESVSSGKALSSDGSLVSDSSSDTTDYLDVSEYTTVGDDPIGNIRFANVTSIAFYNENKTFISGSYASSNINGRAYPVPSGAKYVRASYLKTNKYSVEVCPGSKYAYSENYCTPDMLKEMYDLGFDIGNHSYSHIAFSANTTGYDYADTDESIDKARSALFQVQKGQRWLIGKGFARSARHFAVPGGSDANDKGYCDMALRECGTLTSTNSNTGISLPVCDTLKIQSIGVHGPYICDAQTKTVNGVVYSYGDTIPADTPEIVMGHIEKAVKRGQTLVFMFHDILGEYNDRLSETKYQWTTETFRQLINLVSGKNADGTANESGVDLRKYVVSMSEWYEGLHREWKF